MVGLVGCSTGGSDEAVEGSSVIPSEASTAPSVSAGDTLPADETATLPADETATLPPPAVDAGAAVTEFLAGPGAPLVSLRGVADRFVGVDAPVAEDCVAAIGSLSGGPPPDELGGIAGDVPDVVLSAAFIDLIAATDDYLSRCAQGEDVAQAVGRLGETSSLVAERLGAL